MEIPEVLHELWPRLFASKWERRIKVLASIGLGLVVLGVTGELTFERWRSGYAGLLEDFGNVLLIDAENKLHSPSRRQAMLHIRREWQRWIPEQH
jgi:hypothetical protein